VFQVSTDLNRVSLVGSLGLADYKRALAAIHNVVNKAGFQDVKLDFSECRAAFAGAVLAMAADISRHRSAGVDIAIIPPNEERLSRLFRNAGWLHILDENQPVAPTYVGTQHVPATMFRSAEEQFAAVNRLLDTVTGSLEGLTRHDLGAVEWAVQEVTDNVLAHAEAGTGGVAQLSALSQRRQIELVVVDAGIGIPTSLRQGFPELRLDSLALERAVQEGVTRSKSVGRGNGLFGTIEIAKVSEGYLHIHSGYARLTYEHNKLRIIDDTIPFHGTLVVACLDCSDANSLGKALKFDGKQHEPIDIVDPRYATDDGEKVYFSVQRDAQALGSRASGETFRTRVENLLAMRPGARLILDFSDVNVLSSSFADEVVGKLFQHLGPLTFMSRVELRNLSPIVRGLLDRALSQRQT
jgi:anti-sigma regulatory factor (Ser/Thr protein kinase)